MREPSVPYWRCETRCEGAKSVVMYWSTLADRPSRSLKNVPKTLNTLVQRSFVPTSFFTPGRSECLIPLALAGSMQIEDIACRVVVRSSDLEVVDFYYKPSGSPMSRHFFQFTFEFPPSSPKIPRENSPLRINRGRSDPRLIECPKQGHLSIVNLKGHAAAAPPPRRQLLGLLPGIAIREQIVSSSAG